MRKNASIFCGVRFVCSCMDITEPKRLGLAPTIISRIYIWEGGHTVLITFVTPDTVPGSSFLMSFAIDLTRAGGEFDKKCNVTKKTNRHFVWRNLLNF